MRFIKAKTLKSKASCKTRSFYYREWFQQKQWISPWEMTSATLKGMVSDKRNVLY